MESLTIGKLGKLTGVSTVTIRYYEKRGLIRPIGRSSAKYRLYALTAADQIVFIKNAQEVGFTLKEIKTLLDSLNSKKATSRDIKNRILDKIKDIKGKITILQNMRNILEHLALACNGKMPIEDCPILKKLFQPPKVATRQNNKKSSFN